MRLEDVHNFRITDLPKDLQPHLKVETMEDLFRLLDVDCSGDVEEREFCEGLLGLALEYSGKASVETILMLKVLKLLTNDAQKGKGRTRRAQSGNSSETVRGTATKPFPQPKPSDLEG